jgi:uncharacterized protein YecT (DUF1311 family)
MPKTKVLKHLEKDNSRKQQLQQVQILWRKKKQFRCSKSKKDSREGNFFQTNTKQIRLEKRFMIDI